eukprot:Amastigsp_a676228_324.p2 type:complete len:412 gc:universal Amastigsp_a676228_324:1-1236(+)
MGRSSFHISAFMAAPIHKVTYSVGGQEFTVDSRYQLDAGHPLGKGAYGTVVAATDTVTGRRVAIKRMTDVFAHPVDAKRVLRELKLLRFFAGVDNLIHLLDIMVIPEEERTSFSTIYVVTELLDTDLHLIIKSRQELTMQHHQHFMYQIMRGLAFIHAAGVIHRDMKPSNVVLDADCTVKIVDFGLARPNTVDANQNGFTEYVATRWYRSPEIVYDAGVYSSLVDVWAAGCIFAELLRRKPLLAGKDQVHQLSLILNTFGTPAPEDIAEIRNQSARNYVASYPVKAPVPLTALFPGVPEVALDLLSRMLAIQPRDRWTAQQCLEHPFFADIHQAEAPIQMPPFQDYEFEGEAPSIGRIREYIWLEMAAAHPEVFGEAVEPQFPEPPRYLDAGAVPASSPNDEIPEGAAPML